MIITNNKPRRVLSFSELPLSEQYEYVEYHFDDTFIEYKGIFYPVGEFMRIDDLYWHGRLNLTNTSALFIRLDCNDESVVIGVAH